MNLKSGCKCVIQDDTVDKKLVGHHCPTELSTIEMFHICTNPVASHLLHVTSKDLQCVQYN